MRAVLSLRPWRPNRSTITTSLSPRSPTRTDTRKSAPGKRSATSLRERPYCPEDGDVVWIDFDPQLGREQAGRRPAIVLSSRTYNSRAELCVVCAITNHAKGYPFEVSLPSGLTVTGVAL